MIILSSNLFQQIITCTVICLDHCLNYFISSLKECVFIKNTFIFPSIFKSSSPGGSVTLMVSLNRSSFRPAQIPTNAPTKVWNFKT